MDLYKRSRGEGFGAEVKRRIMTGTYVLSAGYYDAYYLKAQRVRQLINSDFKRAFGEVDVLIGPTAPDVAFGIGAEDFRSDPDVSQRHLHDRREPRGRAGHVDSLRLRAATCRSGCRSAGPHFAEAQTAQRRARVSEGDRLASADSRGVRSGEAVMSASWETVIGLEVHAQLSTKSKIFSGSPTAYGAAPNTQANLVDLAYPGVLPVLNGEAVRMAVKFGLAIGATRRAALRVRAQELLLPGPAEGLPDQPVRAARGREGTSRHRAR